MKTNTAPALNGHDFAALVAAFQTLSDVAPPGYGNWRSIAIDGADAARVEQVDAVKAACRGCHSQYRERYKKEMRERPI
jgi:hypothetical protein